MMRIAREGLQFIAVTFAMGIISLVISIFILTSIFLLISFIFLIMNIFMMVFFRDPDRKISDGIASPADGRVVGIDKITDRDVGNAYRVVIFMNVWNVHVNRSPIDGKVVALSHHRGKHFPAFFKNAIRNEHVVIMLETEIGKVKIVQIAGVFARRIVPYIKKGEEIKKGERIGIIKFGSRVDLYLPEDRVKKICMKIGDKIKAGEDKVAEISS